jgi:hypothetical protein
MAGVLSTSEKRSKERVNKSGLTAETAETAEKNIKSL